MFILHLKNSTICLGKMHTIFIVIIMSLSIFTSQCEYYCFYYSAKYCPIPGFLYAPNLRQKFRRNKVFSKQFTLATRTFSSTYNYPIFSEWTKLFVHIKSISVHWTTSVNDD